MSKKALRESRYGRRNDTVRRLNNAGETFNFKSIRWMKYFQSTTNHWPMVEITSLKYNLHTIAPKKPWFKSVTISIYTLNRDNAWSKKKCVHLNICYIMEFACLIWNFFLFLRARDFLSLIPKMFNCKNITGALYRVKVGNNADFFNLKLKYVH